MPATPIGPRTPEDELANLKKITESLQGNMEPALAELRENLNKASFWTDIYSTRLKDASKPVTEQINNARLLIEQLQARIKAEKEIRELTNKQIQEFKNKITPTSFLEKMTTNLFKSSVVDAKNPELATAQFLAVASAAIAVVKAFGEIVTAGINLAQSLGTSATSGVALEFDNRLQAVLSGFQNPNIAVSQKQIESAQKSLASTFMGAAQGMEISAEGSRKFAENLKTGFKSEFEVTGASMRALITTGIGPSTAAMEQFRKASGRASLSSDQFATLVNKNALSFMLYGSNFAKAAAEAEKMGISLASVQSAQQGLVAGIDNAIDTVAQLNQVGANIDFGNLMRIAETEGPDALLKYVKATVPPELMQSTSIRALFGQLGISAETLLQVQDKQTNAADSIEQTLTKTASGAGNLNKGFTALTRIASALTTGFGTLIGAVVALILTIIALNPLAAIGAVAGLGIGTAVVAGIGATIADDVVSSPGYGDRKLVTPTGTIALNNNDTLMAGTNLLPPNALSVQSTSTQTTAQTQQLYSKLDTLINTINNATTVIDVGGGTTQKVNRFALVGVKTTRSE
jgi:hypothetical protein